MTKVPSLGYEKVINALKRDGWVEVYIVSYSETGATDCRGISKIVVIWLHLLSKFGYVSGYSRKNPPTNYELLTTSYHLRAKN